jgi:hypothetical protein
MAIDLADYETKTREAIQAFWGNREQAHKKQVDAGTVDQGERSGVTAGKNMDGFVALVMALVTANGLAHADIHRKKSLVVLPGFFRPTKEWDLLVLHRGHLVAAIELKSHVGPSFGNNFNNRAEEAIGMAHDFWTAYREKAFGDQPRPFVRWMMLVEDAPESRRPVREKSQHFPVDPDFQAASYLKRYDILCQRLALEQLYTTASVIASPRTAVATGEYIDLSTMTGLGTFVTSLAGHIAAEAARSGTA